MKHGKRYYQTVVTAWKQDTEKQTKRKQTDSDEMTLKTALTGHARHSHKILKFLKTDRRANNILDAKLKG